MGFRSLSATSNEGIFQTVTFADADEIVQWSYHYTEYTRPSLTRCTPLVEFRVNGNDDSNGTAISTAPNVGSPGGPSTEGEWVSLTTGSFRPSDYGVADGGTLDVYLGVVANSCSSTWAFVDGLAIVASPDIDAQDDTMPSTNGFAGNTNVGNAYDDNGNGTDTFDGSNANATVTDINVITPATPAFTGASVPL